MNSSTNLMKTLVKILFIGALTLLLTYAATAKDNGRAKPVVKEVVSVTKAINSVSNISVSVDQALEGMIINEEMMIKNSLVLDIQEVEKKFYTKRATLKTSRTKKFYC